MKLIDVKWWLVLLASLHVDVLLAENHPHNRIVSLDYCSDQFVLKLVSDDQIAALSMDAEREFSYMREAAVAHNKIRPGAEEVLSLDPDLVVRSYGGGANASAFYESVGIPVIQIGYANTIDDVRREILRVGNLLDVSDEARNIVEDMDRRLAIISARRETASDSRSVLYVTPGGVTSGPGTLIHELISAAGLSNFQQEAGWRSLPLEQLAFKEPEMLATAFYKDKTNHRNFWSAARHALIREQLTATKTIGLEDATTACGGWFLVDAVEKLAGIVES